MLPRILLFLCLVQTSSGNYLRTLDAKNKLDVDPFCVDTTATFPLDKEGENPKDCAWLSQNLQENGHLCELHKVSSLCRVTCGVCDETRIAVDLLKTCSDGPEPIALPNKNNDNDDTEANVSCEWLRKHKAELGNACDLTHVALHCPTSCGTFGLCVREKDESA